MAFLALTSMGDINPTEIFGSHWQHLTYILALPFARLVQSNHFSRHWRMKRSEPRCEGRWAGPQRGHSLRLYVLLNMVSFQETYISVETIRRCGMAFLAMHAMSAIGGGVAASIITSQRQRCSIGHSHSLV